MLRVWGRTRNVLTGKKTWVEVTTDANGMNDAVYLTNLAQVCKLNLSESPFFASWGIPAHPSVESQLPPDFYIALTQKRFASRFMLLTVARQQDAIDETGRPAPYYRFVAISQLGATLIADVPI